MNIQHLVGFEELEARLLLSSTTSVELIDDLNSTPLNSDPSNGVTLDKEFFFNAIGNEGRGVWKTNGFRTKTVLVKQFDNISSLHATAEAVYIFSDDSVWVTDGTQSGTTLLKTFTSVSRSGIEARSVGSQLIFSGFIDGEYQMWTSDGTSLGTTRIDADRFRSLSDLTQFNGMIYFRAITDANGEEIWRTDGTVVGTELVADVAPNEKSSFPRQLTVAGNTLFFVAFDEVGGRELWKTDGSTTVLVKDIEPDSDATEFRNLVAFDDKLVFSAKLQTGGWRLWISDGTDSGTLLVTDKGTRPENFTFYNGEIYFTFDESGDFASQIWKTDGTDSGTVLVHEISSSQGGSFPSDLLVVDGQLYFKVVGQDQKYELWQTDGLEAERLSN